MERVLVYGATGYTGRLVARALEDAGRPFVVAGRNRDALEALSRGFASRPEVRVADASDPASLHAAFGGLRAVVNTVGPFRRLGLPVVRAAVDLGVHYVDTTGEQVFQMEVYRELHRRAVSTGSTVITGGAYEFTFSYLGAAVLHERCGPLVAMDSYYLADGFQPTLGTARSTLELMGDELVAFDRGQLVPLPTSKGPEAMRFPGERDTWWAVPIPGGDAVLLPLDIPTLQSASCHMLLPRGAATAMAFLSRLQPRLRRVLNDARRAKLDRLLSRFHKDPSDAERASVPWKVFVRGTTPSGTHLFACSGRDVYAISGVTAALTAAALADGRARDAGVMTTGRALPAVELLDAMRGNGVKWGLR